MGNSSSFKEENSRQRKVNLTIPSTQNEHAHATHYTYTSHPRGLLLQLQHNSTTVLACSTHINVHVKTYTLSVK